MNIMDGGLDDPRVQALLAYHFESARAQTAPGSAHALDLGGLKSPDIRFWSGWDGDRVVALGALKRLSASHGEVKSRHTGLSWLSLETGSWSYFDPARELYRRHGFVECPPFGIYVHDPNSVFMTLELHRPMA
jgi:putative acetyltransferase